MSGMAISCIAFACVFGGGLLGMFLRAAIPEHHLSTDSKDLVKLGMGLIGTMTALVLGLVVASAKGSYERQSSEIRQISTDIMVLDRVMTNYGPETKEARRLLRRAVAGALDRMWPGTYGSTQLEPTAAFEGFLDKIQRLLPQNEIQRALQGQALRISADLGKARWLLFEERGGSIPMPFLVLLILWLAIIFVGFGLFGPPNATVIATLFVSALSVSGAIYLILELDRPFDGHIQVSSAPLRDTLTRLGD